MNNWNNANFNNSFNSPTYGAWDRPSGNILYTPSLEDALSRCNIRNTENVFFHQDKFVFYRIKVDIDGRKYWQEFSYDVPKPAEDTLPVTKADLTDVVERIKRIEDYVFQDVEVIPNEQSNG